MESSKKLEKSILETLAYSSIFRYPLSFHQLGTYLGTETSYSNLVKKLRKLEKEKKISQKNGKYYLYRKHTINWRDRLRKAKKKRVEGQQTLKMLKKIPWIKMLAFSGPLAASNPMPEGDIDVFIIAQKKRTWLTRIFVVLYLKILGKYRTDEEPKNKVCPNLFLSEDSLTWEEENQNLFIASEIVRLQPKIDRGNTYQKFLTANLWIKKYFPLIKFEEIEKKEKSNPGILDFIEYLAYKMQKRYMQKKITNEEVALNKIHFNRDDKTKEILHKYNQLIQSLGIE